MTTMLQLARATAVLLVLTLAGEAQAERLVISLSRHQLMIASNFTGANLVVFGTVERDAATVERPGGYDLAVTVIGPRETMVTFRKERVFGIWVNAASRTFLDVPSYLAVLTTRPIEAFTSPDLARRLQLGLENTVLPQMLSGDIADVNHDDPFRQAFIRLKRDNGLYAEQDNAVTFLTPTLFRATIPVPADIPTGGYEVDVKLMAGGVMIARANTAFEVVKAGFERLVASSARDHGFAYGLVTVVLALLTGWFGSVIFRRD